VTKRPTLRHAVFSDGAHTHTHVIQSVNGSLAIQRIPSLRRGRSQWIALTTALHILASRYRSSSLIPRPVAARSGRSHRPIRSERGIFVSLN